MTGLGKDLTMFKPNIRGVSKRALRFGVMGWRTSDAYIIKHRYPWRRNWLERLAADDSLKPLLARSGNVYLAKQDADAVHRQFNGPSKTRFAIYGAAVVSLLLMFLTLVGFQEDSVKTVSSTTSNSGPIASQTSLALECENAMKNPEGKIQEWLLGKKLKPLTIAETQRAVLGGVQLRRVSMICDQQRINANLTITLTHGEWQLKKFTRLDD